VLRRGAQGSIIERTKVLTMRNLIFSLCFLCAAPAALLAQSQNDVLTGVVTDLGGRPVADAQVAATSLGTGVTRFKTTDESGRYKIYFPETAPSYAITVKRIGFSPVQRTITRRTKAPEKMTIDLQFGGTPVALSMVEVNGSSYAPPPPREAQKPAASEVSVPNPLAEILAMRDSLHLSAVQVVALGDLSDSLQARNSRIYQNIQTLLAKSQEAGDATQMAGSVAMMLEEASGNTTHAVIAAKSLLHPEQWTIVPLAIRDRSEPTDVTAQKQ
jgi:carboxypeptidase family protein